MSDFHREWLPRIIGAAHLIAGDAVLRKAWLRGVRSHTSLGGPGELYHRIFDELDALHLQSELKHRLPEHPALADALDGFLNRLSEMWFWAEAALGASHHNNDWLDARGRALFESMEWRKLSDQARRVVVLAEDAGFAGTEFAPAI